MKSRIDLKKYVNEKKAKIDGYLGAILIGSEATGYATEDSDIDIHIIVDQRGTQGGKKDFVENIEINCNIYPLSLVLRKIEKSVEIGSLLWKQMYVTQGKIIDDPYGIIKKIQKQIQEVETKKGYLPIDVKLWRTIIESYGKLIVEKRINSEKNNTIHNQVFIDQFLIYIFKGYSFYIGYEHPDDFNLSFWKKFEDLLYDTDFAKNHWGRVYPDMIFIDLRENAYIERTQKSIEIVINYVLEKMKV